ncbi:MAG: NUDIX domain-containing protein, partial [Candidatus Omnitrophica bacterium]|nr:NUDIX domain-containing protein [Candidatus Omnitrophota bacterium]
MADELLDIIDKDGNELGFSKMKSAAHKDGDWHKSSHIWVTIGNKIVLQKRASDKEFFPGCFDVACAGHVSSSESYEETALRELQEELGIKAKEGDLVFLAKRNQISVNKKKSLISKEVMKVFVLAL